MSRRLAVAAALLVVLTAGHTAHAQSLGDRLKRKAQEKVGEKIDRAGEKKDVPPAKVEKDASAASGSSAVADAPSAAESSPPGKGVWLNYDFVPGDRTIWYEDFEGNDVGDFPRRLRLQEGNLEVVKVQGKPMLRSADGGRFYVVLPEKLPARFTVETRFHAGLTNPITFATSDETFERSATLGCTSLAAQSEAHKSGGPERSGENFQSDPPPGFVTCAFTVDNGRGIKGYLDEHRTANAPQQHVVLTDTLFIQVPGGATADDPVLIASFRVAAGGKKLYDVLAAKGRVATQGILFDTGSDRLRPQSTPTLAEIGEMLKGHPELKLAIEGHTDNVGQGAANKTLSENRAAAVKQYLVATFGVDAARLTTAGYGDTKPVAPNTTPEGRQNNRRVELVKL